MDEAGESYGELGGQLASNDEKERGKEWARRLREQIARDAPLCPDCGHGVRYHHDVCHYPVAPRAEDCGCERGCTENGETDGE